MRINGERIHCLPESSSLNLWAWGGLGHDFEIIFFYILWQECSYDEREYSFLAMCRYKTQMPQSVFQPQREFWLFCVIRSIPGEAVVSRVQMAQTSRSQMKGCCLLRVQAFLSIPISSVFFVRLVLSFCLSHFIISLYETRGNSAESIVFYRRLCVTLSCTQYFFCLHFCK